MNSPKRHKLPTIGLLWAQFAPYHIDRCEAVAERLAGKAEVLAVEVATGSAIYGPGPVRKRPRHAQADPVPRPVL